MDDAKKTDVRGKTKEWGKEAKSLKKSVTYYKQKRTEKRAK